MHPLLHDSKMKSECLNLVLLILTHITYTVTQISRWVCIQVYYLTCSTLTSSKWTESVQM